MRSPLLLIITLTLTGALRVMGSEARIQKVLPHLLDEKGRISVAPGLMDRDAYQQVLRQSPDRISGVRFDVQWKVPRDKREKRNALTIRLELRTARGEPGETVTVKASTAGNRRMGGWSSVTLGGAEYARSGEVLAWRATLMDGDTELAEQKSFLW